MEEGVSEERKKSLGVKIKKFISLYIPNFLDSTFSQDSSFDQIHTPPCGCGYRNNIVAVAVAAAVAVGAQTATNFQFFCN